METRLVLEFAGLRFLDFFFRDSDCLALEVEGNELGPVAVLVAYCQKGRRKILNPRHGLWAALRARTAAQNPCMNRIRSASFLLSTWLAIGSFLKFHFGYFGYFGHFGGEARRRVLSPLFFTFTNKGENSNAAY